MRALSVSALAGALLLLAACGGPAPPRAPRVVILGPHRTPAARPLTPLEERLSAARDEAEGEMLAEHRAALDGEARLHLVLERDRCYRLWVGADRPVRVRLEDEHGHLVAAGPDWIGDICPRWTGSFALVIASEDDARSLAVLLTGSR